MEDFILFSTQMLKQVQHDKKYLSISMQVQHDKKYLSISMQVQYDNKYLSILMQVQHDNKYLSISMQIQHDNKYLSISIQVQYDNKYLSISMQVQYDYKYLSISMQVQHDGKHLAWQFTIPDYLEPFHLPYQGQYVIENNKIAITGTYENNPVLITGTFTDATTLIDVNSNPGLFFDKISDRGVAGMCPAEGGGGRLQSRLETGGRPTSFARFPLIMDK